MKREKEREGREWEKKEEDEFPLFCFSNSLSLDTLYQAAMFKSLPSIYSFLILSCPPSSVIRLPLQSTPMISSELVGSSCSESVELTSGAHFSL